MPNPTNACKYDLGIDLTISFFGYRSLESLVNFPKYFTFTASAFQNIPLNFSSFVHRRSLAGMFGAAARMQMQSFRDSSLQRFLLTILTHVREKRQYRTGRRLVAFVIIFMHGNDTISMLHMNHTVWRRIHDTAHTRSFRCRYSFVVFRCELGMSFAAVETSLDFAFFLVLF